MSWAVGGDPVKGFIQGFSIGALNHCGDHPTDGYRKITIQRPDAIQSTRSVNLEPIPVPVSGVSVSESGGVSAIDGFQMFLDGAGVVDPTPICDGINALIYLGRGQFGYAGISALGILPYVGDLGKAGKYGAKGWKAAKSARSLWKLSDQGAIAIKNHGTWGKFYKSSDGLWWAIDKTGHGSSSFKVFKETNTGLEWYKDADEFGNFILNKHKSSTGTFIPWGQMKTIK